MDYKPNATKRHATAQNAHARGERTVAIITAITEQTTAHTIATANPAPKAVS